MDRRLFLNDLTRAAALCAVVPNAWRVTGRPRFAEDPFQLGVAAGDPTSTSCVIWTRVAPRPLEPECGMGGQRTVVRWEVAEDERFQSVVREGRATAAPELSYSVHADVDGLGADRWYWYRFTSGEAVSPVGRLRTTPAPGMTRPLAFAFVSCQHDEQGLFTAYAHLAREELDLVAHLGDYIYEYSAAAAGATERPRRHAGLEIRSLDDYRRRYAQYKADPLLQAAHARCPWVVTWDDHEVDNNYAGLVGENVMESDEQMRSRRAAAYQAWWEHQPVRVPRARSWADLNITRTVEWGALARFWVMDTRQYRSDQACGGGDDAVPCGDWADPARTMLGAAQERWLFDGLARSTSRWQVLANQVMVAAIDRDPGDPTRLPMDGWAGYPVARERLLGAIADRAPNRTVVLTGDVHSNWVNELRPGLGRSERARSVGRRHRRVLSTLLVGGLVLTTVLAAPAHAQAQLEAPARPNIIWIMADDMGPELGSYGEPLVRTPNLDRLAREGARYTRAFTTSPICSPSRSALATGMYQTSIGAHQHRTATRAPLPPGVRPITHLLREAGYYTVNVRPPNPGPTPGGAGNGKTDYNFTADSLFDGSDWRDRRPGQPFFAQLTIFETHRGAGWPLARKQRQLVDPRAVQLPPYYPNHPIVRDEVANYLDAVHLLDGFVGDVMARLEREGLAENTVVLFFGDNGRTLVRSKQWLYDGGVHVPLLVRWPRVVAPGTVDDRLVSGIDVPATTLRIAGVPLPPTMQGRPFLGPDAVRREYVVSARDRADVATDRMRSVRTERWKYIRNYFPMIPYMQVNPYMEREYPTWNLLKALGAAGKLDATQRLFLAERKPVEELYDLRTDPHEVRNLAGVAAHDSVRLALREVLDRWVKDTGDQGVLMEDPLAVFRSHFGTTEMADVRPDRRQSARQVYLGTTADSVRRRPSRPR